MTPTPRMDFGPRPQRKDRPKMFRFLPLLTASLIALSAPVLAQQNLFAPRIIINDRAVTEFEYQQRLRFLQLLRAPGDVEKAALEGLIDDRLRQQEAKRFDVKLNEDDLKKGMEEFAARANLSAEEFIKALGEAGVEPETFRDFVSAGLLWREIVRGKYSAYAKVSEEEIDRALEAETRKAALTVGLAELIIPAEPGREAEALALARDIQANVRSEADFSAAVQNYSAAATRDRGGRLNPMPMANLPPVVAAAVGQLSPGQISPPVTIPGAVALFQLRSLVEGKPGDGSAVQVEYARLRLPAGRETSTLFAELRAKAQICKDFYGMASGVPADQITIESQPMSAVPADLGLVLSRLDRGEIAERTQAGQQELIMLCSRSVVREEPVDRNALRIQLLNQKMEKLADQYLATLKAEAIIREP
ncbi:chaperone SurA [Gemmobacter lanyuensis]|uniref:Parvulin-like PPIase n=1 Tax=Gemmobacter lanyuensis TaxID=1054497 RepID=A0A918ILR5_9RHOB|nr:peptidylprolyl isomerase [Gemmobacter lanyuensis]GGW21969.1 chaperone SurA [Gemmobacter lanyuensis]